MASTGLRDEEDRILRRWTPLILRTVLIAAGITLLAGLIMSVTISPDYYVSRFRRAQSGKTLHVAQRWADLATGVLHGDPHDILTLGLVVLTLVPIVRVAFTFVLFVEEGDHVYIVATAYVLACLVAGILLGSIG